MKKAIAIILTFISLPLLVYSYGIFQLDDYPHFNRSNVDLIQNTGNLEKSNISKPMLNPWDIPLIFLCQQYLSTSSFCMNRYELLYKAYTVAQVILRDAKDWTNNFNWHTASLSYGIWIHNNWTTQEILNYHADNLSISKKNSGRFVFYILDESASNDDSNDHILEISESIELDYNHLVKITDEDVVSFNYGLITFNEEASKKLKKDIGVEWTFIFRIFVITYEDKPIITGTFYDTRFASVPSHNFISHYYDTRESNQASLSIYLATHDLTYSDPEIIVLQNYFYSIGKATKLWEPQNQ